MATFKTLVDAMATVTANTTANRASDINNIQNALKDIVSGYSTGTLVNPQQLIVVAKSKGDFTSLASAVAAITDASASKPYAILLMPGIYETKEVTLPNYVSIVGIDNKACILKASTPTSDNAEFVIKLGNYCRAYGIQIINDANVTTKSPGCVHINGNNTNVAVCYIYNTASRTAGVVNATGILLNSGTDIGIRENYFETNVGAGFTDVSCIRTASFAGTASLRHCQLNVITTSGSGITTAEYFDSLFQVRDWANIIKSINYCIYTKGIVNTEHCFLQSTANNSPAIFITGGTNKFYDNTIQSHGTATVCFDTDGAYNINVAHCRMNLASPIHANLTNLIATPYNVMDTDV